MLSVAPCRLMNPASVEHRRPTFGVTRRNLPGIFDFFIGCDIFERCPEIQTDVHQKASIHTSVEYPWENGDNKFHGICCVTAWHGVALCAPSEHHLPIQNPISQSKATLSGMNKSTYTVNRAINKSHATRPGDACGMTFVQNVKMPGRVDVGVDQCAVRRRYSWPPKTLPL